MSKANKGTSLPNVAKKDNITKKENNVINNKVATKSILKTADTKLPTINSKSNVNKNTNISTEKNSEKVEEIILTEQSTVNDQNVKIEIPLNIAKEEIKVVVLEPPPVEVIVENTNNGKVILIYEQYNEEFDIVKGTTTQENIDEVYCLSFVMPNCCIHLSTYNPTEKRAIETDDSNNNIDILTEKIYLKENPRGTYHGLEDNKTYYVYVEQEAEQLKRDQENMKRIAQSMEGGGNKSGDGITRDDGRAMESCSCIYGNPCVDEYGCKDWDNRYAVAMKNGWKGF